MATRILNIAFVTGASPLGFKSVLHERDYPTLPKTARTIWWTFRPPPSPSSTTALDTSASRNLVKDILPRLISGCITALASQTHHEWTLVVCFVDAGVQILPYRARETRDAAHSTLIDSPIEVASPLLYSNVKLYTVSGLDKFTSVLRTADQQWDSIRRIPYSTPGRWVQFFDLSEIAAVHDSTQALVIDSLLTTLFPLMPFMEYLALTPALLLSRRALASLTNRDGSSNLKVLRGVCYVPAFSSAISIEEDPLVRLLQTCDRLECLEVIGRDMEPADVEHDSQEEVEIPATNVKLHLHRLHTLTLSSMPSSSLLHALLNAALPRLRALCLTPYDDLPYPRALTTRFLVVHGNALSTLSFFTPKSWPTRLHPSPSSLFRTCPNLRHLSLESPLPALVPPDAADLGEAVMPLQILSIPRPVHDFWRTLETLLPLLPSLNVVRIRDVRWLRKGLNRHAQEAGVQGEMRVWRLRLAKRGICLLDGDWKDMD